MAKTPIPSITDVYRSEMELKLYEATRVPEVPALDHPGFSGKYPHQSIQGDDLSHLRNEPIKMCSEYRPPYNPSSPALTIRLQDPLSTGVRERPAQVWTATFVSADRTLLARLYDPLFYHIDDDVTHPKNPFMLCDRSVAVEKEVYTRLRTLQRSTIPALYGVFVAQVSEHPRHVYVVLLEWVQGALDVQEFMKGGMEVDGPRLMAMPRPVLPMMLANSTKLSCGQRGGLNGKKTCIRHKAVILDAAARIFQDITQFGIYLDDLAGRNTLIQFEAIPSPKAFCSEEECPLRHWLHIDPQLLRGDTLPGHPHQYSPRVFLIDMEHARFVTVGYDLDKCRRAVMQQWNQDPWFHGLRTQIFAVFEECKDRDHILPDA
ncbi:hypothetical protein C8R43DRAFT_1105341 [Mycena crocata]|nr:hypothetical protein C8R43DRAFT_1105341 [Mycena crocata]